MQRVAVMVMTPLKRLEQSRVVLDKRSRSRIEGGILAEDLLVDLRAMENLLAARIITATREHFQGTPLSEIELHGIHIAADIQANKLLWTARFDVLPIPPDSE